MAGVEKLLEPIKIGKLELKNRMMMPALCSKYPTESGAVSDRMIDFYVERARGGASLIVIENTCIDWPVGKAGTNPIRADEWRYVHGLHDLAKAVQAHGTRIATQLHHTGRQNSTIASTDGEPLVAPSPIPCLPTGGEMPRELTIPEIDGIIGKYVMGASITKTAGFDAVEIHGAHGYLITQFMSPFTNKRTDEYGGDFEGRMRFPLRVVEGVRLAVGPDFPIIFRFSADEYIDGGLTLEDNKLIAQMLVDAGVDALSVSAGIYESTPWYSRIFPTMAMPEGCNVHLAAEIKKVVKVPVIVAGKLGNPEFAAEVLSSGKADIIAFGRPLLADPDLPKKVSQGRLDEIRPCIYCNEACAGNMSHFWRIECVVNPDLGREREYRINPAQKSRRVLVVGGGPAGMEAARVAALRGHDVSLQEKEDKLGGQLVAASVPQFKRPIQGFAEYLENQVKRLGVNLQLGSEVSPESIRKMKPDVVILATGSSHTIPDITGVMQAMMIEPFLSSSSRNCLTAHWRQAPTAWSAGCQQKYGRSNRRHRQRHTAETEATRRQGGRHRGRAGRLRARVVPRGAGEEGHGHRSGAWHRERHEHVQPLLPHRQAGGTRRGNRDDHDGRGDHERRCRHGRRRRKQAHD